MMEALKNHATKHFQSYLIALLLGLSGWLVAIYDNFYNIAKADMAAMGWWQVMALVAKCSAGGVAAIIGFMMKSPLENGRPPAPKEPEMIQPDNPAKLPEPKS